ncbi:CRADD protein, partial [Rhinopomastus cyanomelas]|nr:CRADD protein [Rhinopomastus cyanomelas]
MAQGERETLLALQRALTDEQFDTLKYLLEGRLPLGELRPASRPDLCRLLLQYFPGQALGIAADLLRQIPRHDLLRLYQLPGGTTGEANWDNGTKGDVGPTRCDAATAPPVAAPATRPCRLTDQQLLQVAQKLGRGWQEVGIGCLGLGRTRLEQIAEDEPHSVVLRSFEMLREWRRREGDEATAPRLCACLAPMGLDPDLLDLIQSFRED